MKALFKLLFTGSAVFIPVVCAAQYSFSITIHGAGSPACSQAAAILNKQISGIPFSGIPTKGECESARRLISTVRASVPGCNVYYTCTPCVGTDISRSGGTDANTSNLPVQNSGVEIRNSVADYEYKREVQAMQSSVDYITIRNVDYSQTFNAKLRQAIEESRALEESMQMQLQRIEGSKETIQLTSQSLIEKLNSGYRLDDLVDPLKSAFAKLTGVDVASYINKPNLTDDEWKVLDLYNEFCEEVLDGVQKSYAKNPEYEYLALEMAMYALHAYDDDPAREYDDWCRPLKDVSVIPDVNERKSVQHILDYLSENNNHDGFQADFYYDADKDSYVLAFRGSEGKDGHTSGIPEDLKKELPDELVYAYMKYGPAGLTIKQLEILTNAIIAKGRDLVDFGCDISFIISGQSPQHDKAAILGDVIKDSGIPLDKLTITGHSLGGSLALLAGIKSGANTYAYDPLHINKDAVANYKLNLDKQNNIICYEEKGELLVRGGEYAGTIAKKLSEANKMVMYDQMGMDSNMKLAQSSNEVFIGSQVRVEIPSKEGKIALSGSKDFPSMLNHSIGDMVEGISAMNENKTSSLWNARNMRQNIAAFRAEKRYEQHTSAINFSMGGLKIKRIKE